MRKTEMIIALLVALALAGCGKDKSARDAADARLGGTATKTWRADTDGLSPDVIDQVIEPFNRGVALMDQYRPVEAAKAFEQVVLLAPEWITGRLNYGIALLNSQSDASYARAEEELKWVIARDPDNPYAHYSLAMLLKHLGRIDEAQAQFEQTLKIDPDDPDTHYQLGILIAKNDPALARQHLEKTLQQVPHHGSACYRLATLLRQMGEKEKAKELLLRFRSLKATGAGVYPGMKYGEMGRYAEVRRTFGEPAVRPDHHTVPVYEDIAKEIGLVAKAAGVSGWPGALRQGMASDFGPGIAAADVDGNGDLEVYLTGAGDAGGILYRRQDGRFVPVRQTGIDAQNAIGAYFGDYDGDGDPDLYLTCAGPNRLYRNDGDWRFTDVTAKSATAGGAVVSVGAAWADADHDGDLDIYVANFSALGEAEAGGAANVLWRNNGDGTFTEAAAAAGIDGGDAASMAVLVFDFDNDRDLDLYLINWRAPNRLFLNDRIGRYTDATAWFPELADAGPGLGALAGDLDGNGREDLLLLRGPEPPRLFLQTRRGRFSENADFAKMARDLGGAAGGLLGDLDLDGDLDLVLLSAGTKKTFAHRILMNTGQGRFAAPVALGGEQRQPQARGAIALDLDGDGGLELLVTRADAAPQVWHAPVPASRHWLEVIPAKTGEQTKNWIDPTADGLIVEVKAGRRVQVASVAASSGYLGAPPRRAHFGLGEHAKADYVRLTWSDAVIQSELEVAADQSWRITKMQRKPSSCPILFTWNGERFDFVTDFLGVGGVGFFITPGEYAPPDPTEDVRIPPEKIAPRGGRYLLRIAEPLEEVTYLDQLQLIAYDHPADWEIYPDERFTGTPPFPTGKPFAVARKIFPESTLNDRNQDRRERILKIDRRYVEPPLDPRFVGYAQDHWLELDFGKQLDELDAAAPLVLYLYGWVEYTYSHVNYAAYQAGITMRSPSIEIPDGHGGWRVVMADAGFPAGLPRMMTLDISDLPIRKDGRLRIRSNMEIFWDQIFIGENVAGRKLRPHIMKPVVAELRHLGYPREFSPDGADPTLYDYQRVDQGIAFKNMTGSFTRFGDVRALLEQVDDRFVVMARGEEVALEFDATALPGLPAGWARTLVLHSDGYCKDMDLYTAFPNTVEPFPFHAMQNYPPEKPVPDAAGFEQYQRTWNTRYIMGE